ncbi:Uncharacterized protein FKW44_018646 [Caligus rogercresseyi]|uniref:Uncharacterized protein n=1 Tax=Caligus rogercresseyi TaxID=217165 RepID=A0A7T8GUP8_CALRO|nr:Uncharacterized protein FKW44_018646 [Caligus rogercresseyi]
MAKSTRSFTHHTLFGSACVLPVNKLPSKGDMLRCCWQYKCDYGKFTDVAFIIKLASKDCTEIWRKAIGDRKNAPLLNQNAVEEKLKKLYKRGIDINKNASSGKKILFLKELNELFDICNCQCPPTSCHISRCKSKECDGYHLNCQCEVKVPKREVRFLLDQRSDKVMVISGVDVKVTKIWEKATNRDNHHSERLKQEIERTNKIKEFDQDNIDESNFDSEIDVPSHSSDIKFIPPPEALTKIVSQNRTRLPTLAATCDRYLVSNYAGVAIASVALIDYGVIDKENTRHLIGPHKLRNERKKYRDERMQCDLDNFQNITSLYFDGKNTLTKIITKNEKTNKWTSKFMKNDHYVILSEPDNVYLTHVTPKSGHGKEISRAVHEFLVQKSIVCVGCDGTNTNVGSGEGAIHQLEILLCRPLHYFICQLHRNELPFRAVFYMYDGKPSGPVHCSGPIGTKIKEMVSELPMVEFEAIKFNNFPVLIEEIIRDLSWDQKYLYRICIGIINGTIDKDLAAIEPGPPCVSRGNTLWSRILRLYVATLKPSNELKRVVFVIIKFSAPMWFFIKLNPYAKHGSKNVFQSLQYIKKLNSEERSIIQKTIKRNAFFAHTDQLLLCMCTDEDLYIRKKAVLMLKN